MSAMANFGPNLWPIPILAKSTICGQIDQNWCFNVLNQFLMFLVCLCFSFFVLFILLAHLVSPFLLFLLVPLLFSFFLLSSFLLFSPRPPGFHTMTPGSPNAQFGWSTASNPGHKSTRRPQRVKEKSEIRGGRSEGKRAVRGFWAVRREGGPAEGGPAEGGFGQKEARETPRKNRHKHEGEQEETGGQKGHPPAGGPGDEVSKMQMLVTELNQLAAERDALSRELRSRAPKARSWGGDGPPDLNNVPPLPTNHQAIEEWVNARNCGLRDALEFGYADVISQVSNVLAQGASKMATLSIVPALALQVQSMDVQTPLGNRMCYMIDAADAKRRCLDGGGH